MVGATSRLPSDALVSGAPVLCSNVAQMNSGWPVSVKTIEAHRANIMSGRADRKEVRYPGQWIRDRLHEDDIRLLFPNNLSSMWTA